MSENYEHAVEVTVKEFCSPFKPNVTRYEFQVTAGSEQEAIKIASGKVTTRGYPYDETLVRVLHSKPILTEVELQEIMAKTKHLEVFNREAA